MGQVESFSLQIKKYWLLLKADNKIAFRNEEFLSGERELLLRCVEMK